MCARHVGGLTVSMVTFIKHLGFLIGGGNMRLINVKIDGCDDDELLEYIARELCERMMDVLLINGIQNIKEQLKNLNLMELDKDETLVISHKIYVVGNDIRQIIGRYIREKEANSSTKVVK